MRRLAIILVAFLALSGCKIRFDMTTHIEKDGSGTIALFIGFDKDFLQAMNSLGQLGQQFGDTSNTTAPTDPIAAMLKDVPSGWKAERATQGDTEGVRISRSFTDVRDIPRLLNESENLGSAFGGATTETTTASSGEPNLSSGFSLNREGDIFKFRFDAKSAGFSNEELMSGLSEAAGGANPFGGSSSPIELELNINLTLPGKILTENADERHGNELTWHLTGAKPRTISASSDASKSGGSSFPVIPVVIGAAVVVGLALLLLSRRGGGAPAAAAAAAGEGAAVPPSAAAPPPPPPPPAGGAPEPPAPEPPAPEPPAPEPPAPPAETPPGDEA